MMYVSFMFVIISWILEIDVFQRKDTIPVFDYEAREFEA